MKNQVSCQINERMSKETNLLIILILLIAKGGIDPKDCISTIEYIENNCFKLNVIGLMTIGSFENSENYKNQDNPDFLVSV